MPVDQIKDQRHGVRKINIYTHPQKSDAFMIYVMFPVGAIHESKNNYGCSHILEHLLFKNKNNTNFKRLTEMGMRWNGFTSFDITCYFMNTVSKYCEEAIDIIHAITMKADFNDYDLARERDIILEEYYLRRSSLGNTYKSILFNNENPYNKLPIGTPQVIKNISLEMVKNHHKTHYKRPVVVAICDVTILNKVSKRIQALFGKQQTYDFQDHAMIKQSSALNPRIMVFRSYHDQEFIKISFYTFPTIGNARRSIIADFIEHCLSGASVYSLLNQKLRLDRGMVYTTGSANEGYLYTGVYSIALRSVHKADHILTIVLDILTRLKRSGLGSRKLLMFYMNHYLDHLETKKGTDDYYLDIASTVFYSSIGDDNPIALRKKIVRSLTNFEISEVAKSIFDLRKVGIMVASKVANASKMNNVLQDIIESYVDK